MLTNITRFIAKQILTEDPVSITLDHLNGELERLDVQLHRWAFAKLDDIHENNLEVFLTKKLKKVLQSAAEIPFWKSRFRAASFDVESIASCQDIARMPIATQRELCAIDVADRSNLRLSEKLLGGLGITSGTTGYPIALYRGKKPGIRSEALFLWMTDRIRKGSGLLPGTPMDILNINIKFQRDLYEKTTYIDGLDLENEEKRRTKIYPLILQKKPEILYTYPSNLKRLMHWLVYDGVTLDFLKAVIYTAEHLDKDEKVSVKKFFNCPIYSLYGTAESSFIAMECAQNEGFHLLKGWGHTEIVSPRGDILPPGSYGRIVYTNFENNATPFVRYDTGDRGTLFDGGACACGITGLKLIFEGRSSDLITLPNGVLFTLHRLHGELSRVFYGKILQLQTQEFDSKIRINIVPTENFGGSDTRDLISLCQKIVGAPVPFEVSLLDYIKPLPSGKNPLLIKKSKVQ